ncbi:peptide methionine sulfoxide reductase MsrA [Cladochytrium replicatum]|nr:peptide methionine sulfoxide reductase MsrA [Cladochytrium replicatum]
MGNVSGGIRATNPAGFPATEGKEVATFAAGCFWGVEKVFAKQYKDARVIVGYAGGSTSNPSYGAVCSGMTGHAESVQIEYPPSIAYADLVDFFFRMHDPTTKNRQGNDVGSQYRSAIFVHSDDQEKVAKGVMEKARRNYGGHVSTTIERIAPPQKESQDTTADSKLQRFWTAEDKHQEYLFKNPHGYECATHFVRSWEWIRKAYGVKDEL